MFAIKATYDGTHFKPEQPLPVQGRYEVIITFVSPISQEASDNVHENLEAKRKTPYLLEPAPNKTRVMGRLKGTVTIPDDFDEPLDEMKEYMY